MTHNDNSIHSHAFVTFPDDASASAAVKQGATFKNTTLKVAFQTKRADPQKRSVDTGDNSGKATVFYILMFLRFQ